MAADIRRLMILRTDFSSPNQRESTKRLDDQREEITLKWGPTMRRAISEVRNKYLGKMKKPALNFYGLLVVKESDKEEIMRMAEEANNAMHGLSDELGASIKFIPLYLEQDAKGEVYQQVLGAIQSRIFGELFGRLKELAKLEEIPKQSRTALIKMCDRLSKWNVVDDPNIKQALADIKLQFENDVFKPVMEDLRKELANLKSRGAFLEFEEGTVFAAPTAEAEPEAAAETLAEAPAEAEKPAEPEGPSGSAVEE